MTQLSHPMGIALSTAVATSTVVSMSVSASAPRPTPTLSASRRCSAVGHCDSVRREPEGWDASVAALVRVAPQSKRIGSVCAPTRLRYGGPLTRPARPDPSVPEFPTAARDGPIGDPIVGRAFGVKEPVGSTVIPAIHKRYASATLNVRPHQK
jgi:hypothetical protein